MGVILRKTAYSPNIRDRIDCSCAVVSIDGRLIAQAEHIPVHLGSMAIGVKNIVEYLEREGIELDKGDVIIVNDPYIAGTHLNDITLLKPVFYNDEIICFVANKAYHVDIGGNIPGNVGGDVKSVFEEGLIIPPSKLVRSGVIDKCFPNIILSNVGVPRYTLSVT